jgi:hypothetical protein
MGSAWSVRVTSLKYKAHRDPIFLGWVCLFGLSLIGMVVVTMVQGTFLENWKIITGVGVVAPILALLQYFSRRRHFMKRPKS